MIAMILAAPAIVSSAQLPRLHVHGKDLVDTGGKVVALRGCNLGNWLMIELWMLGIAGNCGVKDQYDLFQTLDQRFGRAERDRLIDEYRSAWIKDADFDTIKSFGFNVVRLPMDYRLFEDDERPLELRREAFKWTDRCVDMASRHGIYVILDMHGIQGGQSPYDHTGRSDQNKFWTSTRDQERAAWLWEKIAAHYRNNDTVVAYDLMNEPYGGTHEAEKAAYPMLYRAVRRGDRDKLVFFHGHYDAFEYYGDPKDQGLHNVGFEMHYYPGLFGNGEPTRQNHEKHLADLKAVAEVVDRWNVPFFVGEMNPVFASVGVDMMRRTFDVHQSFGWSTTMWSYKLMTAEGGFKGGSWGMVTNHDPAPRINFRTAPLPDIEDWIHRIDSMRWDVYDALRETMVAGHTVRRSRNGKTR